MDTASQTITMGAPRITIISLPVETSHAILAAMPDVTSLIAKENACTAFFDIFNASHCALLRSALCNQIHPEMMPKALAVYEAGLIPAQKFFDDAAVVLDRYQQQRAALCQVAICSDIDLSAALSISQFHGCIQAFAREFISATLSRHPISGDLDFAPLNVAARESLRVERAFYRYHLISQIFQNPEIKNRCPERISFGWEGQDALFFEHNAP